ncbi:MAG: zinc-binding dehydrogenase [Chloroflexi bacterium]|nr:zinc-binding dehydrogenase [Chloroflexota bacterium]
MGVRQKAAAVVFAGERRVEIREITLPELGPQELLVRTELTGISVGTDRWIMEGRYRGSRERWPYVYGYQRIGVIEALGPEVPEVTGLSVGDRVFVGLSGSRFDPADGLSAVGGGYTSHGVVHYSDAWSLGDLADPGLEEAALGGVAAVALLGVQMAGVKEGELAVVVGQGVIGQVAAQLCRLKGARVIATDLLPMRREISARWSADRVVDPQRESLAEVVRAERASLGNPIGYGPGGRCVSEYEWMRWDGVDGGADVVIDTAGSARLVMGWFDLLRRQGRLCLQAYFADPLMLDFHQIHLKRATVQFPGGFDLEGYGEVVEQLRQGRLQLRPLITHRLSARKAGEAFQLILDHPDEILGMVLDWRDF